MVDRRVVNSHDASTVVSVVSKLDRRRVLIVSNTIDFEGNSHAKSSIRSSVSMELRLMTDTGIDTDTDRRHKQTDTGHSSTALAGKN